MVATNPTSRTDPRDLLGEWGNSGDEWVRYIVRHVLTAQEYWRGTAQPLAKRDLPPRAPDAQPAAAPAKAKATAGATR